MLRRRKNAAAPREREKSTTGVAARRAGGDDRHAVIGRAPVNASKRAGGIGNAKRGSAAQRETPAKSDKPRCILNVARIRQCENRGEHAQASTSAALPQQRAGDVLASKRAA